MLSRSVGRCIGNIFRNRRPFHQSIICLNNDDTIQSYQHPNTKDGNDSTAIIKSCTTSHELLNCISKNVAKFSARETMVSLNKLFELQKDTKTSINKEEIVRGSDFEKLCRSLKRNARNMELNDLIDALKIVTFVGVKQNSEITMSLLNLIKYQINDASLGHIIFLNFLLERMESSPLVDALLMALPTLLQIQISTQLDHENTAQLVELLRFVSYRKVSDACIMNICSALILRGENLSPEQAKDVIWSLSSFHLHVPKAHSDKLLEDAIRTICQVNINEENIATFGKALLKRMTNKYLTDPREFETFYSETFFKHCADSVVKNDLGFDNAVFVQSWLNNVYFVHLKLLKYILQEIEKYPRLIVDCKPFVFIAFVSALSNANFKPVNWDKIKTLILRSDMLRKEKRTDLPWVKLSEELLSLGIECPWIWDRIFSERFLKEELRPNVRNKRLLRFLDLYQAVALTDYNVEGRIDQKYLNRAKDLIHSIVQCPMQQYIEMSFGGPEFVFTKVRTKHGQIISHVIAFEKDTMEPAPINNDTNYDVYYDDIATDESKQYIAVVSFPDTCFCSNIPILKSIYELKLRTYEKIGITAVWVNQKMWIEMPDAEKGPYLKREVKLKLAQVLNVLQ